MKRRELPLRAMVLAAGEGRRLRPLTVFWAKPAIPLLGASPVECAMELLRRARVSDVVVNLHHNPETIEETLAKTDWGRDFALHYSRETEILGTAGGLKHAERWLSDGTFLLLNGDTILDTDLTALVDRHRASSAEATLLLRPKPEGTGYTELGLAADGRIVSIGKKGESSPALMFAGLWVLEPTIFQRLTAGRFARLEVDLLPKLILEGTAFGFVAELPWLDIGTPEAYLQACEDMARSGLFRTKWRAEVVESLPSSPLGSLVLAGPNTSIDPEARFTGTSILGANCRVERGAHLRRAVLWDHVTVGDSALVRDSVIASDVSLAPASRTVNKLVALLRRGRRDGRSSIRGREIAGDCVVAPIKS
ncbi:MAG: sugar phosphate nucleotidyltransferase [Vicinamibacteria bacterium]